LRHDAQAGWDAVVKTGISGTRSKLLPPETDVKLRDSRYTDAAAGRARPAQRS
jgi:hypothetical protein